MSYGAIESVHADFPPGSKLECHVEKGDAFFSGDHAQVLRSSLWIAKPDGSRSALLPDFATQMDLNTSAVNLRTSGIPLRVIQVYDGQGVHTEQDITQESTRSKQRPILKFLAGTSSLFIGALAGGFVHDLRIVAMIGLVAFVVIAVVTMRPGQSRKSTLVQLATLVPSYGTAFLLLFS
jgi:hypothetical protein